MIGSDGEGKLDSGLRRLLRMSDGDVLEAVRAEEARVRELDERLAALLRALPPKARAEERDAIARLQTMYRVARVLDPLVGALRLDPRTPALIRVRALVHFAGNRDDLAGLGLEVTTQSQDIFSVVGTRPQLATLAAQPATLRMQLPRALLPAVEKACAQAEILAVHEPRPENPTGFHGKGVIVGVVDMSSLDVTHHGFRAPDLKHGSRVLYYWVQRPDDLNAPGQTPAQADAAFSGLDRGRLYTRQAIDAALAHGGGAYGSQPGQIAAKPGLHEHGTHVAGVAAGNGRQSDWTQKAVHVGAAPEADLIYVRLNFEPGSTLPWDTAFEDALMEGIDFILRAAQKHDMPVAVNVSMATHLGAHNGASLLDQWCDNKLNSYGSRCIVCAAGNGNDDKGFQRGTIAAGGEAAVALEVHPWLSDAALLDVWYSGPELEFRFEHGNEVKGWFTAGQEYDAQTQGFVDMHKVSVERDAEPGGGLRNLRFTIVIPNAQKYSDKIAMPWTIRLRNAASDGAVLYHAWTGLQAESGSLGGAKAHELTLADTGCAKAVLTVGSCTPSTPKKPEPVTAYSGAGPTLDGRIKPEIVAVGGTDSVPVVTTESDLKSGYVGDWGTSMAAPLVTGAVALLFEAYAKTPPKRGLTHDLVKSLLIQTANRDGLHLDPQQPGYSASERNRYGNGRLRMVAPIDHSAPLVDVDVWLRTAEDDYGQQPYPGSYFWASPDILVTVPGTGKEITELTWGETYDVVVTCRNLGTSDALGTMLRLKYSLPHAAPNDWVPARRVSGALSESVQAFTIPALSRYVVTLEWRPMPEEVGGAAGSTHFCLLAELDHPLDKLHYVSAAPGVDAWARSIMGTNNIALQNVHIY